MKNRSKDVLYCGVREDVIKAANPVLNEDVLANLYEFVHDRYEIHKKKDVEKLPAPWTDNPIFLQVKFTNVRREHDRESRNVIENICSTKESLKDRFFNIILMRFWNKFESYKIATGGKMLKFPLSDEDFKACNDRIAANGDHTWWSGAYYTCPVRSWLERIHFQQKIPAKDLNFDQSPIYFAKYALTDELWEKMEAAQSPKELFEILTAIPWMGKFLVYQWFVDFTYCEDYWFSENEFTVSGPGCTKGVDLLFADRDGMTHEECLFWMRNNQRLMFDKFGYDPEKLFSDLPDYDRYINIMSFENLMCELQKFQKCKAAVQEGKKPRGKSSYDGLGVKAAKKAKAPAVDKSVNLFEGF
jgi:hypothetical protein